VLTTIFLLARLAGLEEHTSVLAGTHGGGYAAHYWGALYLILHAVFVCLVPIVAIAGSLLALGGRWTRAEDGAEAPTVHTGGTRP
jgi:hypothetical protein